MLTPTVATTTPSEKPSDFERGARAAAESMRLYFQDENEGSLYAELPNAVLNQFENSAIADALNEENSRLKHQIDDAIAHGAQMWGQPG